MIRVCSLTIVLAFFDNCCFALDRYAAMFADGSRAQEAEVREWCEPTSQPKIAGRNLFDPNVPVRWIIDRNQPPVLKPPMYVEFVGLDRLAGEVVGYSDGHETPYETQPPHLIVRPVAEVQPPDVVVPSDVRVTTDWLRRVVWEQMGTDEYRPGTIWLRSGTSLTFRTLRWNSSGVTLLTNDGVKELALGELGEIHLPKINPWAAYYDQLAILSPETKSRVIQIHGLDGSRWTTSFERFQSRHLGDRNRPEQWYQLIQPAWSLDSVWLRYRTLRAWQFFVPHEIPLSNFAPVQVKHQALFGAGWGWQTDQNAHRGLLQSFDQDFGWGFGVHGTSELVFEYPETARAVRTQFGLDRIAGTGGCVNVELLVGNDQSVMKQANLTGSAFVSSMNWLDLPSVPSESRRITLRTEMAHTGRPAGADPFDIRDVLNWYEPEIRLDPVALQAEVASRVVNRLPGFIGWTLSDHDAHAMKAVNVTDVLDARDPVFRRAVRSTDSFYILSRKVKVGSNDHWMAVIASRFAENTSPTAIQIRVDGRVLGEFEVPLRQSIVDPEPMLVSVQAYRGKSVSVELIVYPGDEKSWVDWRGFSVGPDRPGLLTIFEEDVKFAELLNQGPGRADLESEKPYSGARSLKVSHGAAKNPSIPGLDALICETPRLGQFRFAVFAWKKTTGTRLQLQFANRGILGDAGLLAGAERPQMISRHGLRRTQTMDERGQRYAYTYEAGAVTPQPPFPSRLSGDLPRDWQLVQRDLFGDFGLFHVTGLSLNNTDGDAALFDHIYLARTNADLEFAARLLVNPQPPAQQPDGNGLMPIHRREDFPLEISRLAPLFSALDLSQGLIRQTAHNGQTDVLRTHANAPDKPMILKSGIVLPKDRPMMLDLHLSNQPQFDWQLVVRANGEVLHDQLIDDKLTMPQKGWATIQVDLSKFAGQKVLLEVLNQSNNWQNEIAFWKHIRLVER